MDYGQVSRRTHPAPDETTARLGEIRERVAAATEGPWEHGDRQFTAGVNERFGTDACAHCRRHGDPTWIGVRDINGQKMLTHVHTDAEPWWKHGIFAFRDSGSSVVVHDTEYGYMDQADAEFIAHAREDVPWLLAEVERLTAERDRARDLAARLEEQVAEVESLTRSERMPWGIVLMDGSTVAEHLRAVLDAPEDAEFVDRFFVKAQGMSPDAKVTRIEWRYLDGVSE